MMQTNATYGLSVSIFNPKRVLMDELGPEVGFSPRRSNNRPTQDR